MERCRQLYLLSAKELDFFRKLRHQFLGRQAGIIRLGVFGINLLHDAGYPNHEKFIQVRGCDGKKIQALHNGIFLFKSFLQHPKIKSSQLSSRL